eukprot:5551663-Prymnesium_polylepis.1
MWLMVCRLPPFHGEKRAAPQKTADEQGSRWSTVRPNPLGLVEPLRQALKARKEAESAHANATEDA